MTSHKLPDWWPEALVDVAMSRPVISFLRRSPTETRSGIMEAASEAPPWYQKFLRNIVYHDQFQIETRDVDWFVVCLNRRNEVITPRVYKRMSYKNGHLYFSVARNGWMYISETQENLSLSQPYEFVFDSHITVGYSEDHLTFNMHVTSYKEDYKNDEMLKWVVPCDFYVVDPVHINATVCNEIIHELHTCNLEERTTDIIEHLLNVGFSCPTSKRGGNRSSLQMQSSDDAKWIEYIQKNLQIRRIFEENMDIANIFVAVNKNNPSKFAMLVEDKDRKFIQAPAVYKPTPRRSIPQSVMPLKPISVRGGNKIQQSSSKKKPLQRPRSQKTRVRRSLTRYSGIVTQKSADFCASPSTPNRRS